MRSTLIGAMTLVLATAPGPSRAAIHDHSDWLVLGLSLTTFATGLSAGIALEAAGRDLDRPACADRESPSWPCTSAGGVFGAATGLVLGSSIGAFVSGEIAIGGGDYGATMLGALGGLLLAPLMYLVFSWDESGNGGIGKEAAFVAMFVGPPAGAVGGYLMSARPGRVAERAPAGGLIDLTSGRARLHVPAVGMRLQPTGAFERVDVSLFSGRF